MDRLKRIVYRGGIAEFDIPAGWREEYEPLGGATFYDDRPDSGTLRLSVLGFKSKDTPAERMAATAFRDGRVESTRGGLPLRLAETETEEDGELLHIYKWEVAVPAPPNSLRLALFSYTILASQKSDAAFLAEVALLDSSIREATFSQEPGVAGEYEHP